MSRAMVRLRDNRENVERQQERRKKLQTLQRRQDASAPFDKAFADLTVEEKDDLLKRLAIMAGLVEE